MKWIGKENGPVDFYLGKLAVQLKSTDKNPITNWSDVKSSIKKGFNQLKDAIDNGQKGRIFEEGRLDLMIKEEHEVNIDEIVERVQLEILDTESFRNYNFKIEIGKFYD